VHQICDTVEGEMVDGAVQSNDFETTGVEALMHGLVTVGGFIAIIQAGDGIVFPSAAAHGFLSEMVQALEGKYSAGLEFQTADFFHQFSRNDLVAVQGHDPVMLGEGGSPVLGCAEAIEVAIDDVDVGKFRSDGDSVIGAVVDV